MEKPVVWANGCSYIGILPFVGVVKDFESAETDDFGRALAKAAGDEIQGAVKRRSGPFVPLGVNDLILCGEG
jgi:hypothetical protein